MAKQNEKSVAIRLGVPSLRTIAATEPNRQLALELLAWSRNWKGTGDFERRAPSQSDA
jgi:hypothetical protein